MEPADASTGPRISVPSLLDLCCQAVASGNHYRYQRRYLDILPQEAANTILSELLQRHKLSKAPGWLSLFKRCVTCLAVGGREQHIRLDATWVAYVAELVQLRQLKLIGDSSSKAVDKVLAPITALHDNLQELSLLGDPTGSAGFKLTTAGMGAVNQLTALRSLDLSGVTTTGPVLSCLTALALLTHLSCEGLPVTDADCAVALPLLPALASLVLSGCADVSDASYPVFAQLPALQRLDLSWSGCHGLPCFGQLKVLRMANSQLSSGEWCTTWLAERGEDAALCLEAIDLSGSNVGSEVLHALSTMIRCSGSCLKALHLTQTDLNNEDWLPLLLCLGSATQLTSLRMGCIYAPTSNEHLHALAAAGCSTLTELSLSHWSISSPGVQQLALLPSLAALDLAWSWVQDADLPAVWQLTHLTRLDLSNTRVSGVAPAATRHAGAASAAGDISDDDTDDARGTTGFAQLLTWGNLSRLQHLDVHGSNFADAGFAALAAEAGLVASLRTLLTSSGGSNAAFSGAQHTTGKGIASIGRLTSLHHLSLEMGPGLVHTTTQLVRLQHLTQLVLDWHGPLGPQATATLQAVQSKLQSLQRLSMRGQSEEKVIMGASPSSKASASPADSGPWQQSSLRRQSDTGGSSSSKKASARRSSSTNTSSTPPEQKLQGKGTSISTSPVPTISLAAYDQRMRYTAQELLELKAAAAAVAGTTQPSAPDSQVRRQLELLPAEIINTAA